MKSLFGDDRKALFIRRDTFESFSDSEKENHIEKVFQFYRKNGFPHFPSHRPYRIKKLIQAKNYPISNCIDQENKTILLTMQGLSFCWSYHPHHWGVTCNSNKNPMEIFESDDLFRELLWKCMHPTMGHGFQPPSIRKTIQIFKGTQRVQNFRPLAAAAIYQKFCPAGGTVYDMSSGYGGRALGAHLAGVKYFGVDPCTENFNGVQKMISDFEFDAEIKQTGSEVGGWLKESSIDFSFTSPPYFNCEKYSNEPTQSYIKYPTKELWLNGFLGDTLKECQRVTKDSSVIALNIASVRSYRNLIEDVLRLSESIGLQYLDTWKLQLSGLNRKGFKFEPILIFNNCKNSL